MKLLKEIYLLPDGDQFILYAPLIHTIIKVNKKLVSLLKNINDGINIPNDQATVSIINKLIEIGVIDSSDKCPDDPIIDNQYLPTSVTFLPTSDCNLKCIYCYADSGTSKKYLSAHIGKSAIDFICKNALTKGVKNIQIGFLGGGEPFLAWDFVTEIHEYAKNIANQNGLSTFFTGVTNGVMPSKKVRWISENFQYLNISVDGEKSVHDKQRPTKRGNSSFESVLNTIRLLNDVNFEYSIRTTISDVSVKLLTNIVKYFIQELGVKRIHLEPLFACGRCKTDSNLVPSPNEFAEEVKKCYPIAISHQAELLCSSARLDNFSSTYCGALVENFYITPDGHVTACTEVSNVADALANIFIIGKYDHKLNGFDIWDEKRKSLMSRSVNSLTPCRSCIAKWHCSGGCPAKAYKGNVFKDVDHDGCIITRELTEYHVRLLADGKDDFFPRITATKTK